MGRTGAYVGASGASRAWMTAQEQISSTTEVAASRQIPLFPFSNPALPAPGPVRGTETPPATAHSQQPITQQQTPSCLTSHMTHNTSSCGTWLLAPRNPHRPLRPPPPPPPPATHRPGSGKRDLRTGKNGKSNLSCTRDLEPSSTREKHHSHPHSPLFAHALPPLPPKTFLHH
jgi:hypothetical protein